MHGSESPAEPFVRIYLHAFQCGFPTHDEHER